METPKGDVYSAAHVQSTAAINCSCSAVQEHLADIPATSSVVQGRHPGSEGSQLQICDVIYRKCVW